MHEEIPDGNHEFLNTENEIKWTTASQTQRYSNREWDPNQKYNLQFLLKHKEKSLQKLCELYDYSKNFKNSYKLDINLLKPSSPHYSFIAKQRSGEYFTMSIVTFEGKAYFLKPIKNYPKILGISHEAFVMSRLRHENIAISIGYAKIKKNKKYLALEYLPLTLDKYLESELSIKQKIYLIIEIGRALCFLHMKRTVFSNLSPYSIHIDEDGKPKLFDFELCTNIEMEAPSKFFKEPDFASPEAIMGCRDMLGDIYSYGILSYYILTNRIYCEFIGLEGLEDDANFFPDDENKYVISELRKIIEKMIDPISARRPTAEECYIEFNRLFNI